MSDSKMSGFYPVLNEIHDKAVKELPLAECALFEHLWRKLIGWGKFEDEISYSQLAKETSACRATIINLLKNLEEKRWITVTRQSSKVNRKFTNKIAIPACPGIKSRLGGSIESRLGGSLKSRHTTDIPKDNLKTNHTTSNIVTTGEGAEENSENGGGVLATSEKTDEEFRKIRDKLGYHQVREPERTELAEKYDTRYLMRQMAQIDKDRLKGITFRNYGGALVARIRRGHVTEDYPG